MNTVMTWWRSRMRLLGLEGTAQMILVPLVAGVGYFVASGCCCFDPCGTVLQANTDGPVRGTTEAIEKMLHEQRAARGEAAGLPEIGPELPALPALPR